MLAFFPAGVHGLTLVRDPDGVLGDEALRGALAGRRFSVVDEADPVLLRHRVEGARPFGPERPLVVVTAGALEALPYDLWRRGHWVELGLHAFFPNLDYPTVRSLGAAGRARLGEAPLPSSPLGQRGTIWHVLRHAFGAELEELGEPAALVAWLTDYHRLGEAMPAAVAAELLGALRPLPTFAGWDLDGLVGDGGAFARFVGEQWRGYVGAETGRVLNEAPVPYLLGFGEDAALQDGLPRLLRTGVLTAVDVAEPGRLPGWARSGVVGQDEDRRSRRADELCALLGERLAAGLAGGRWPVWQGVAWAWAELAGLRDAPDLRLGSEREGEIDRIGAGLDGLFAGWLRGCYAALAGQRLPVPHHVFHVPEFLAYRMRRGSGERVALLVVDGLALRDWRTIGEAWRARHQGWVFEERLLLAQIPTITAVSRQALVAGLRPADFAETIGHNRAEGKRWAAFWGRQEPALPAEACAYGRLDGKEDGGPLASLGPRVRAVCLIEGSVDEIVHGARLGAAEVDASLRLWLDKVSPRVEGAIDGLLAQGFAVSIGSDHGHVAAWGIGQPAEGVAVETRGRRARTYREEGAAARVRAAFPETELWGGDGLLPEGLWAAVPRGRAAFAPRGETVVTHGGLTLDEVVVPFVTIGQR